MYAYASNELFDPISEDKLLRFFSMGGDNEEGHNHQCIAVPRAGCVDGNTLFADVGDNANRMLVEDALLINCRLLTLG